MQNIKIKKGDTVKVIVGKDSGKLGVVEKVFRSENLLIVKGIHILKKHVKPSKSHPTGGIIEINKKINISNVSLLCPVCGKTGRVKYKIENDLKIRVCSKCGKSVEGGK